MVKLRGRGQFYRSLGNAHIDALVAFGAALFQSDFQLVDTGRFYKYGQRFFGIFLFDAQAAGNVYIKNHIFAVAPNALHFALQSAVEVVAVHFFPLQKIAVFYVLFKILQRNEIIVLPVFFIAPRFATGAGNGKLQIQVLLFQQMLHDSGFATSRWCRKHN